MNDERLNHVKLSLDPEQFPETIQYFEAVKNLDHISSYELVSGIINCDRTKPMPRQLFEFVVSLYEQAISQGDADAMNDLGSLYYDGRGCEQSFTKTVHYYEMAAEHGHELAQENLGYCYYYGRNIPVDYEKAFKCFAAGAFCGRVCSLYKIGDMYRNGYYVGKNPYLAFRIYLRCSELMDHDDKWEVAGPVFLRLGTAYLNGEGTEKDPAEALRCFQIAERYLYAMVMDGEAMYRKSLKAVIDGQDSARKALMENLL